MRLTIGYGKSAFYTTSKQRKTLSAQASTMVRRFRWRQASYFSAAYAGTVAADIDLLPGGNGMKVPIDPSLRRARSRRCLCRVAHELIWQANIKAQHRTKRL